MLIKIDRKRTSARTLREASTRYCELRDAHLNEGKRGSDWPSATVEASFGTFYISFNGKVWTKPVKQWTVGDVPVTGDILDKVG
jgi:hypothetical protein